MSDDDEKTYKVVRKFFKGESRTLKTGLTLEEAQEHCEDPETSSSTCTHNPEASSPWFDAYYEE
jgi:hypothetical protein